MRLWWLVLLTSSAGCGVLSGLDDLTVDAGVDASPPDDASLDVGSCDAGACGAPAGFQPILFATGGGAPSCPQDTTQHDFVADSIAPVGACGCNCNYQPSCLTQPLVYGTGVGCATQTKTNVVLDGGCNQAANGPPPTHVAVGPFAPTNACTNTVKQSGNPTDTPARICNISSCSACSAPMGFELCFAQNGNVPCPTGLTPHAVGSSSSLVCSACTACSSTAQCKGTLQVYDDANCFSPDGQLQVDGTCQTPSADFLGAFKYMPTIDPGVCTPGTSTATITLAEQTTVCCP
ncbi:MAG TPA: hypothetical protein VH054_09790 [Polyangiaceae bacterium]|jgi:hypothetical protein|nr:hypothetical protein [Polyangiaceae bacterium]